MYFAPEEHPLPHFHVYFSEYRATVDIRACEIVERFPATRHRVNEKAISGKGCWRASPLQHYPREMCFMKIRTYEQGDQAQVVALWQECNLVVPWNDPLKDIDRKLNNSAKGFLVGLLKGQIVSTIMYGYDGHRGSVNYLAVSPNHRNMGLGEQMMNAAQNQLISLGCPKINLMVRDTNLEVIKFYESIGYKSESVVVLGKRIISDE